jgi:hypothetical protein
MNKSNTTRQVASKSGERTAFFTVCVFKTNHKANSLLKAVKQPVKSSFELRVRPAILLKKPPQEAIEPWQKQAFFYPHILPEPSFFQNQYKLLVKPKAKRTKFRSFA